MSADIHQYEYTQGQIDALFPDEAVRRVIASSAFNRLKSIRFLGAIDYILPSGAKRPEKRHTRYQHSLAVAHLAQRYCEHREMSLSDNRYCVIAALLHDIGHAPLSHSLESVFRSRFELDHHVSGERIIKGEVPIGEGLSKVLSEDGVNNFRILSIIEGLDEPKFNEVFAHAVNIDTIEAILRSLTYIYKVDSQLTPARVLDALVMRSGSSSEETLDAFWHAKDEVYSKLIQGKMGLMADFICKRYMEINSQDFSASYYFGTEEELRRDHEKLFEILEEFGRYRNIPDNIVPPGQEISCVIRRFKVDKSVRLNDIRSVDRRYQQEKRKVTFEVKKGAANGSTDDEYLRSGQLF